MTARRILLTLIVVAGGWLRLHDINDRGFLEIDQIVHASQFKNQKALAAKPDESFQARPLFFVSAKLFSTILGWKPWISYVGSGVFGTLTIIVVYFWASLLAGPAIGVAGAALLAFSSGHIWYSRVGNGVPEAIFFFTLGLYFYSIRVSKMPKSTPIFGFSLAPLIKKFCLFVLIVGIVGLIAKQGIISLQAWRLAQNEALQTNRNWIVLAVNIACAVYLLAGLGLLAWKKKWQPVLIGFCFGLAGTAHYSFAPLSLFFLLLYEVVIGSFYRRFNKQELAFLLIGWGLPFVLFQMIGYPSGQYFRDFFNQYRSLTGGASHPDPFFFFRLLHVREGLPFLLMAGAGLAWCLRHEPLEDRNLLLLIPSAGIFLGGTLTAAKGEFYAGRMIASSLPALMILTAMGALWIQRKSVRTIALALVLGAQFPQALRAAKSTSGHAEAARWLAQALDPDEKMASLMDYNVWALYFPNETAVDMGPWRRALADPSYLNVKELQQLSVQNNVRYLVIDGVLDTPAVLTAFANCDAVKRFEMPTIKQDFWWTELGDRNKSINGTITVLDATRLCGNSNLK